MIEGRLGLAQTTAWPCWHCLSIVQQASRTFPQVESGKIHYFSLFAHWASIDKEMSLKYAHLLLHRLFCWISLL
jgi:hypothetical protein